MTTAGRTTPADLDLAGLRRLVRGDVFEPGDPGWDAARMPWNVAVDQRPSAIVRPAGADDVAAAVRFARDAGLPVAMQTRAMGRATTWRAPCWVRTDRMTVASVDAAAATARAEPAARWRQVHELSAPHGLAGLSGYAVTPAIGGFATGGGFGWLGRRYGFAANSIRALEVVTADGAQRRVDARSDPDLFWALRGGGGGFAAVTALEVDLFPVPALYAGRRAWPIEHAPEVVRAFRDWAGALPDTVGAALAIWRFPPIDLVPEIVRGRQLVTMTACVMGSEAEAAEVLGPLGALPEPYFDTFGVIRPTDFGHVNQEPEDAIQATGRTATLSDLADSTVGALLEHLGPGVESPIVMAEIRRLGGAVGRSHPGGGCVGHVEEAYMIHAVGVIPVPEALAPLQGSLRGLMDALRPHSGPRMLLNQLPDPAHRVGPPARARRRTRPNGGPDESVRTPSRSFSRVAASGVRRAVQSAPSPPARARDPRARNGIRRAATTAETSPAPASRRRSTTSTSVRRAETSSPPRCATSPVAPSATRRPSRMGRLTARPSPRAGAMGAIRTPPPRRPGASAIVVRPPATATSAGAAAGAGSPPSPPQAPAVMASAASGPARRRLRREPAALTTRPAARGRRPAAARPRAPTPRR